MPARYNPRDKQGSPMKRPATPDELDHAERWLSARVIECGHERDYWYFGELPDPIRIILDTNYAEGDEATFASRDEALNSLAVTLAECLDGAGMPK
jgi:hypothetical protein